MSAIQKAEHQQVASVKPESRLIGKDQWMEHVLARDRLQVFELIHLDRHSLNLLGKRVLTDQAFVAMPLDL